MTKETILFIILSGVVAAALSFLTYGFRSKTEGNLKYILGFLRFLVFFAVGILLINPKLESISYTIEKVNLPVLTDNSASIEHLGYSDQTESFVQTLKENKALNDKFDLSFYTFGSEFRQSDSLSFQEKNTNISGALNSLNDIFRGKLIPTILITDGNQTLGRDYEFVGSSYKSPIYPVIIGDSIQHPDLKIEQLNTNKYAFLKNLFPVEVILSYSGEENVSSEFIVSQGNSVVYREKVSFSKEENSKFLNFNLTAHAVGIQKYTAQIVPLDTEKNKTNNLRQFAVEVMDEATKVLIVSQISHPDLGAIKTAITTNEQREAKIVSPEEAIPLLNDSQLIILYQPNRSFQNVFKEIEKLNKNLWIFSGLKTDWNFLHSVQKQFLKKSGREQELIQGKLNSNFSSFAVEDIGFKDFPPLSTHFGYLMIDSEHQVMLEQTVRGFSNGNPLVATLEDEGRRFAIWDGEGMWRWRARSFINQNDFKAFDDFLGSIVQYLASNKRRSQLEVAWENFYYNHSPIKISAQYFDKNYVFDNRGKLEIKIKNKETEETKTLPMLLKNNYFEVDLGSLSSGDYSFTVSVVGEAISREGSFTIIEYDVEQQFLNADVSKLNRVAQSADGKAYMIGDASSLIEDLLENNNYKNIQKAERKTIPLIEWKYLLGLIALFLTIEWFIRKYNGLI